MYGIKIVTRIQGKQQNLFHSKQFRKTLISFGGAPAIWAKASGTKAARVKASGATVSNPKTARPVSCKHANHVVIKSYKAIGSRSFVSHERWILNKSRSLATGLGVELKDIVVHSNHIHLLLRVSRRRAFFAFLRALCGLIARKITSKERGLAKNANEKASRDRRNGSLEKFFAGRPFSRIVSLGRKSYKSIKEYFDLNRLEKLGYSKEVSRKRGLQRNVNIVLAGG